MRLMQKLTNSEIVVIITAVLVALIGIGLECLLGDSTNMFQRFGSIIVCIGIIFGALDIKSIYSNHLNELIKSTEEKREETDIVFSVGDLKKGIRGSTNYIQSRARSIKESGENRVVLIDTFVLVLGTLVWGFGDLLF